MTDMKDPTMMTIEHSTEEKDSLKEKTEDKEVLKEEDTMVKVINDEQSFITHFLLYF